MLNKNNVRQSTSIAAQSWLCVALRMIAIFLTTAAVGLAGLLGSSAYAQTNNPVIIATAELLVFSGRDTSLPIRVQDKRNLPRRVMLVVRGLPPDVSLTEGQLFGAGVWVVPVGSIERIRVSVPPHVSSDIKLDLQLATLDGEVLTSVPMLLSVRAEASQPVAPLSTPQNDTKVPAGATATNVPRPQQMTEAERATALKLMIKAEEHMKNGNINLARQLYLGAAERGLAKGAYALAQTYDPKELAKMNAIVGVESDAALASQWYERAKQLGYTADGAQ